jgi:hypothetical protein
MIPLLRYRVPKIARHAAFGHMRDYDLENQSPGRGIAVTIAASQLKDLGGLTLPGAEPGPLFPKLAVLS